MSSQDEPAYSGAPFLNAKSQINNGNIKIVSSFQTEGTLHPPQT